MYPHRMYMNVKTQQVITPLSIAYNSNIAAYIIQLPQNQFITIYRNEVNDWIEVTNDDFDSAA